MSTGKRLVVGAALAAALVLVGVGAAVAEFIVRNEPVRIDNIREHFKYGSFGSEARGIPFDVWKALPQVYEELLPDRPGEGYERFGYIFETVERPDGTKVKLDHPIGTSLRDDPISLIGLNCAVCHTGTVRYEPGGERHVFLGMPAHQFDLQAYARFLFGIVADDPATGKSRFDPGKIMAQMKANGDGLSWLEEQFYRVAVFPRLEDELTTTSADFAWWDVRPDQGPGRVDTFNPYKVFWNDKFPGTFDLDNDDTIGTADLPSLWLQGPREGMELHWDGNNDSVRERNRSAAVGAGASEASLEEDQLIRIADWIEGLPPPEVPFDRIDWDLVPEGREVWLAECAVCHAFDGAQVGRVVPIGEIGTDRHRLDSFSAELAGFQNMLGAGRPWALSRFKKTDGYANSPLDGLWLRAPYLHNGSVPTLRDLLEPPEDRPEVFWRGYDVYDFDTVGFVTQGPEAEREGFRFDTSEPGNGNEGHLYGVDLTDAQKDALIEYLKTL